MVKKNDMTREEFEEILASLKSIEIYDLDDDDEVLANLYEKYGKMNIVARDRGIDKHRWYELSEIVIQFGEWFIGAYGISQVYSESMGWADTGVFLTFYELKQVEVTVYDYVNVE